MKKECKECEGEGFTLTHDEDGDVSPTKCEKCNGSGYGEHQLNDALKPFNFTLSNCVQMSVEEMSDKMLKSFSHKYLKRVKRNAFMLCHLKREIDRRKGGSRMLTDFNTMSQFNIFQIMTHATIIGVNRYNRLNEEQVGEEE